EQRQRGLHAAQKRLAGGVQHDATTATIEQRKPELLLQPANLLTDRTVREVHCFGRSAQVLELGHGAKRDECVQGQAWRIAHRGLEGFELVSTAYQNGRNKSIPWRML